MSLSLRSLNTGLEMRRSIGLLSPQRYPSLLVILREDPARTLPGRAEGDARLRGAPRGIGRRIDAQPGGEAVAVGQVDDVDRSGEPAQQPAVPQVIIDVRQDEEVPEAAVEKV